MFLGGKVPEHSSKEKERTDPLRRSVQEKKPTDCPNPGTEKAREV